MALRAVRTTPGTSGFRSVRYINSAGKRRNAVILGPGSASGVKLRVESNRSAGVIDNVALATADRQTSKYYNRIG